MTLFWDNNASLVTSAALPTTLTFPTQSVSAEVLTTFGLAVSIIGILANTVVLVVLILARRQYGSSVNIFIINQSAMDLFSCANLAIMYVVLLTHGFVNHGNPTVYYILCFAVESATLTIIGLTAGKFGLVVITLERYVKVVHAIAHRKYYSNWMTKVGVALPWIFGTILIVFPSIIGTRVSNGRCLRIAAWPVEEMYKVRH